MYWVYILYSKKYDRFYTGLTNNLDRRLNEHNSGNVKPTKSYIPWVIIHREQFSTRLKARDREKFIKSGFGREWRKLNIPR
jgi:putative endonuclease